MNSTSRSRRELLQLLGVCAAPVLAGASWSIWRKTPQEEPLKLDATLTQRLRTQPAEVVLLGNSMIHGRMDPVYLNELWKPLTTTAYSLGATRPLHWLLWLKNQVLSTRPVPKIVCVLYRDYDFHNLGGSLQDRLLMIARQSMVPGDEMILRRARGEGSAQSPRAWLDQNFSQNLARPHVAKKISDHAYDAASVLGPKSDRALKLHVEDLFALRNLRTDLLENGNDDRDSPEITKPIFNDDPAATLLPDFIALADSQRIKLVFYHVKRRPNAENVRPVPPELETYTAALKAWVETRGHYHLNETSSSAITLAMYQDYDHLKPESYRPYTELFAAQVRPLLPSSFTPAELTQGKQDLEALLRTNPRSS